MDEVLAQSGLSPHDVVVEITERVAIVRHDEFQRALRTFKERGYRVAVDDMGAGYASLQSLASIEPDFLKFDVSLVRDIDQQQHQAEPAGVAAPAGGQDQRPRHRRGRRARGGDADPARSSASSWARATSSTAREDVQRRATAMRNAEVIRQWKILKRIEAGRYTTAQDLADEHGVTERTIRRDIEALQEAGFPLYDERADGRKIWRLVDGYKQRLTQTFTLAELSALYFSKNLMSFLGGAPFAQDLESAFGKIRRRCPRAACPTWRASRSCSRRGPTPGRTTRASRT